MPAIEIRTGKRTEIIDITADVRKVVEESGGGGIAVVYTLHTTTAVIINEAEPGLLEDIVSALSKIVPTGAGYKHDRIDDNADAHIRAVLLGNSVVVPVENGKLQLGTWQRILFVELDGPRTRRVIVKLVD
ncbi:secondary thiamine-phosphate synthase enzyme YjbQ [Archaeoglobus veneficus]|uniref:YjbQ family protein n=1 Tax=Archaeoglobus veneficus (strain DSM 11195 / SNP6) TaxID=693661 RepID=F2KNN7_ARCVS|nr:secondary thiamine-phosphate synthase enzyme YjbQ [Archaeoglobus veneficus]AEA46265.1 protein of unknown function UPF0047 [Archaeoglobus veneficus SNP6]